MKMRTVRITGRTHTFRGDFVAIVEYRRAVGAHDELMLYRDEAGRYVVTRHIWSEWQGSPQRQTGAVCPDERSLVSYLGLGEQECDLLLKAGIDPEPYRGQRLLRDWIVEEE